MTNAQQIIERAEGGEKVSAPERRHALAYLMVTEAKTQAELADLFGVSARQIRNDIQNIREEKKEQLRVDDIALVVVDLQMNIERQLRDLENSKKKCKEGTDLFVKHCTAIAKIQLELNKALQDLGWLPKNMGNMSISHYTYEAVVQEDGTVISQRMENVPVVDAEIIPNTALLTQGTDASGSQNQSNESTDNGR